MQGDAASLHRLAVILLDNAIKYAGTGGAVTLRLAAAGSQAVLTVHNTGTPIPPDRQISFGFLQFIDIVYHNQLKIG